MIFSLYIFTVVCSKFYPEQMQIKASSDLYLVKDVMSEKVLLNEYDFNRENFLNNLKTLIQWNSKIILKLTDIVQKAFILNSSFKAFIERNIFPELRENLIRCCEITKEYKKTFEDNNSWLEYEIFIMVKNDLEKRHYKYTEKNLINIKKHFKRFKESVTKLIALHNDILDMQIRINNNYTPINKNIQDLYHLSGSVTPTDVIANALTYCAERVQPLTFN